jgi:putative lipoic acid-binding regulatory protein
MNESLPPADTESLITFPQDFPIKIMGLNHLDFEPQMIDVVRGLAPDLDLGLIEARQSSGGKYLSLTLTVHAQSRAQLDAIYLALTSHPMVKVVL